MVIVRSQSGRNTGRGKDLRAGDCSHVGEEARNGRVQPQQVPLFVEQHGQKIVLARGRRSGRRLIGIGSNRSRKFSVAQRRRIEEPAHTGGAPAQHDGACCRQPIRANCIDTRFGELRSWQILQADRYVDPIELKGFRPHLLGSLQCLLKVLLVG